MSEEYITILRSEDEDADNGRDITKCHFYSDDVCRRKPIADRNCLKCLSNRYTSLYSLNWNNQNSLNKQLQTLEKENQSMRKAFKEIAKTVNIVHKQGEVGMVGYEVIDPKKVYDTLVQVEEFLDEQSINKLKGVNR